jgi:hypothetical protein
MREHPWSYTPLCNPTLARSTEHLSIGTSRVVFDADSTVHLLASDRRADRPNFLVSALSCSRPPQRPHSTSV